MISKSEILFVLKSLTQHLDEAVSTYLDNADDDDEFGLTEADETNKLVEEAKIFIATYEAGPPTRVIVIVEGGVVQGACSSDPGVSFDVLDKDDWDAVGGSNWKEYAKELDSAGDGPPEIDEEICLKFQALSDEADNLPAIY